MWSKSTRIFITGLVRSMYSAWKYGVFIGCNTRPAHCPNKPFPNNVNRGRKWPAPTNNHLEQQSPIGERGATRNG